MGGNKGSIRYPILSARDSTQAQSTQCRTGLFAGEKTNVIVMKDVCG